MREWRLRDIEATREKERARTLRRLGPLPDPRPCVWCGNEFTPKYRRPDTGHCSKRCKDLTMNRRRQDAINATKPERSCVWCGKDISKERRVDAKFCSADCNSRAHLTTRKFRRRLGENEKRKGTPLISLVTIGDRDGWRCGLCGGRINRNKRHPDPLSPSLDHVIPIAHGGSNDAVNLQVTHLRCNLAKRDRPAAEQLRLI